MSLLDALNAGIKTAHDILNSGKMEATVMYQRASTNTGYAVTLGSAVPMTAVVDQTQRQVRRDGIVVAVKATLTLIDLAKVLSVTSGAGINANDVFTLPDGTTGPIISLGGFVPSGTGVPVATEVMIG